MEIKTINYIFSLFADLSFAKDNLGEFKQVFKEYSFQEKQEMLNNKESYPVYFFIFKNEIIEIHRYRVNYIFNFAKENTKEDFLNGLARVVEKLTFIKDVVGFRIALNSSHFVPNEYNQSVNRLNKVFNAYNLFDENSTEFQIRLNHIHRLFDNEDFNSILMIRDGEVTENVTKEKHNVIIINTDINTVISKKDMRFSIKNALFYTEKMLEESTKRVNTIVEAIDDKKMIQ